MLDWYGGVIGWTFAHVGDFAFAVFTRLMNNCDAEDHGDEKCVDWSKLSEKQTVFAIVAYVVIAWIITACGWNREPYALGAWMLCALAWPLITWLVALVITAILTLAVLYVLFVIFFALPLIIAMLFVYQVNYLIAKALNEILAPGPDATQRELRKPLTSSSA